MPTYEFECPCGKISDYICRIADRPDTILCLGCGSQARFILSAPQIQADDSVNVPWIREFADSRPEVRANQRAGKTINPTIESRSDYKKYLASKDLRPADGPNLSEV